MCLSLSWKASQMLLVTFESRQGISTEPRYCIHYARTASISQAGLLNVTVYLK